MAYRRFSSNFSKWLVRHRLTLLYWPRPSTSASISVSSDRRPGSTHRDSVAIRILRVVFVHILSDCKIADPKVSRNASFRKWNPSIYRLILSKSSFTQWWFMHDWKGRWTWTEGKTLFFRWPFPFLKDLKLSRERGALDLLGCASLFFWQCAALLLRGCCVARNVRAVCGLSVSQTKICIWLGCCHDAVSRARCLEQNSTVAFSSRTSRADLEPRTGLAFSIPDIWNLRWISPPPNF